jgi:hypothetical protein
VSGPGTVTSVKFQLDGQEFFALNGGAQFTFTPAISFFVDCETQQEADELWEKLSERIIGEDYLREKLSRRERRMKLYVVENDHWASVKSPSFEAPSIL